MSDKLHALAVSILDAYRMFPDIKVYVATKSGVISGKEWLDCRNTGMIEELSPTDKAEVKVVELPATREWGGKLQGSLSIDSEVKSRIQRWLEAQTKANLEFPVSEAKSSE